MNFLKQVFKVLQIFTIIFCVVFLGRLAVQHSTYSNYWGNNFETLIESLNFNSIVSEYCVIDIFDGIIQEVIYEDQERTVGFVISSQVEDRNFSKSIFLNNINNQTIIIVDNQLIARESFILQPIALRPSNTVYVEVCSQSANSTIKDSVLNLTITQSAREDD
jgi:hypothetical protein